MNAFSTSSMYALSLLDRSSLKTSSIFAPPTGSASYLRILRRGSVSVRCGPNYFLKLREFHSGSASYSGLFAVELRQWVRHWVRELDQGIPVTMLERGITAFHRQHRIQNI